MQEINQLTYSAVTITAQEPVGRFKRTAKIVYHLIGRLAQKIKLPSFDQMPAK